MARAQDRKNTLFEGVEMRKRVGYLKIESSVWKDPECLDREGLEGGHRVGQPGALLVGHA